MFWSNYFSNALAGLTVVSIVALLGYVFRKTIGKIFVSEIKLDLLFKNPSGNTLVLKQIAGGTGFSYVYTRFRIKNSSDKPVNLSDSYLYLIFDNTKMNLNPTTSRIDMRTQENFTVYKLPLRGIILKGTFDFSQFLENNSGEFLPDNIRASVNETLTVYYIFHLSSNQFVPNDTSFDDELTNIEHYKKLYIKLLPNT